METLRQELKNNKNERGSQVRNKKVITGGGLGYEENEIFLGQMQDGYETKGREF